MKKFFYVIMAMGLLCSCANTKQSMGEPWGEIMSAYLSDTSVNQIVLVKYLHDSEAAAEFYAKTDGSWLLIDTCTAYVGRNGLGKEREGDGKTPVGELTIGQAFGILPDPGTSIPYLQVTDGHYCCEDSDYYNQIIDTAEIHRVCAGEHLIDYVPHYNYALTTSYNNDCIYGLGSAIFVHCQGDKPYTAGCIAFPEPFMKQLLLLSDQHLVVSVH